MHRTIEATGSSRVAFGRAEKVLLDDPGAVFGDARSIEGKRDRRFHTDLSVDIGAGASVHQMVDVQLGVPKPVAGGFVFAVQWEATGRELLLPTFRGELALLAGAPGVRLRLHGTYSVPLGAVGKFGDGVIGHRLARRSLVSVLDRLTRRLESEVRRRSGSTRWAPELQPVDLRHVASDCATRRSAPIRTPWRRRSSGPVSTS
jgi:hypothetical protein